MHNAITGETTMATATEISNRYGGNLKNFLIAGTLVIGRDAYLAWVAK